MEVGLKSCGGQILLFKVLVLRLFLMFGVVVVVNCCCGLLLMFLLSSLQLHSEYGMEGLGR